MQSSKITSTISRILVYIIFAALAVLLFTVPMITDYYIENLARIPNAYTLRTPTIVFVYAALVPAFAAIFALNSMLRRISLGSIFVSKNVTCLTVLYICCFAECAIFFGFGLFYIFAFILSFAALFMGVMLRIVGSLMAQAVEIKNENDYTV